MDEAGNWYTIAEDDDEWGLVEGAEGYLRCWRAPGLETVEEEGEGRLVENLLG